MLSNPRTDSLNCASETLEIALKLDCEAKFSIYESELFKSSLDKRYPSSTNSLSSSLCADRLTKTPIPKFASVESMAT